jgi:hypothetical protein
MEDSHEPRQASVQRRRVPADGEAGIFSEDDRVELMDGEVVEMAPIGDRHVESVMRLNRLISRWALIESGLDLFVSVQNPVSLGEHWEPQPDLKLPLYTASGNPVMATNLAQVRISRDENAVSRVGSPSP